MSEIQHEPHFKSLKQSKLQNRVRESILEEIKNGSFSDGKLPTETKLAKMLGVSRPTISITLAYMEREGIVVRRHGSACYVNQGYRNMHSLINQGVGMYDLIRQNGYTPSLISDSITTDTASNLPPDISARMESAGFDVNADDEIYCIQRVFGANGAPSVLTQEFIPAKYTTQTFDSPDSLPETIYKLSEQYCISPIEFTLVEIIPCRIEKHIQEKLQCEENEPVLLTEEIHLSNRSIPMIFSRVYVVDKYIRFQAIRIRE